MRSLYDSSDSRGADQRILLQNPADVLAPDIINALTLKEFLPDQVELFLLGSAALGISDSGSDVDVLACSATISNAKFFEVVAKALDAQGYGSVEMAADAAVPLVRFQADDLEVEVQFSEVSSEHLVLLRESHTKAAASSSSETLHAYETLEAELFMPKEVTSQVGLAAALDVWALTRQLREGHFDRFRRLAVAVKCWARQLGDGSSLGIWCRYRIPMTFEFSTLPGKPLGNVPSKTAANLTQTEGSLKSLRVVTGTFKAMPDDQASASELRRRYQAGGDKDDQLSASQLRARHGVQNGTAGSGGDGGMNPVIIAGVIAVIVAIVFIGMKMSGGSS
eukprot:symbB.v1.2.022132.t1/scaffold1952.1/size95184/6